MQQHALDFDRERPAEAPLWSVTALNLEAKQLLEQRFARVQVQGEIFEVPANVPHTEEIGQGGTTIVVGRKY